MTATYYIYSFFNLTDIAIISSRPKITVPPRPPPATHQSPPPTPEAAGSPVLDSMLMCTSPKKRYL